MIFFALSFGCLTGRLGVKVTFVGCDHSLEAPALYRCHKHYQVPQPGEEGYVTELLHICKQEKIALLIPRTEEDVFILFCQTTTFINLKTIYHNLIASMH